MKMQPPHTIIAMLPLRSGSRATVSFPCLKDARPEVFSLRASCRRGQIPPPLEREPWGTVSDLNYLLYTLFYRMLHGQYPAPGYRRSSRRLSIPLTRLRGAFCGVRPLAVVPFSRIVSEAFLPQALLGCCLPFAEERSLYSMFFHYSTCK